MQNSFISGKICYVLSQVKRHIICGPQCNTACARSQSYVKF